MVNIGREAKRRGLLVQAGTCAPYKGGWFLYATGVVEPVFYTDDVRKLHDYIMGQPELPEADLQAQEVGFLEKVRRFFASKVS